MKGNLAIVNANVIPMADDKRFSAILVENGDIRALGTDSEILALAKDCEVVDAQGATVLPGLFDCHVHALMTGMNSLGIDMYNCKDIAEVLSLLREAHATWEPERFLFGKRLDESRLAEGRPPVMAELDEIPRPVLLSDRGGHYVVLNRLAFEALKIDPTLRGVRLDEQGQPNGRLQDEANKVARGIFFDMWPRSQRKEAIKLTAQMAVSKGITTIDAMEGFDGGIDDVRMILDMKDELPFDINVFWLADKAEDAMGLGMDHWVGDLLIDGTIGSRTAAFRDKFADGDTCGYLNHTDEYVYNVVDTALKNDLCMSFHVIGELGILQALEQMEKALKANPEKKDCHRLRLEHFGYPRPEDIERCARLHIPVSTQPSFTYLRGGPHSVYRSRLGEERERKGYSMRRFLDGGLLLGGGSDSDITPMDSLLGIHAAVNPPYPENALTPYEAVRMFTADAAKCSFQGDRKGTLEVGKQGDLVLLAEDPMTVPDHIKDIKVLLTVHKGEIVYRG